MAFTHDERYALDLTFTTIIAGAEQVTNGAMAADTDWTKGTGWTIAAGVANTDASQTGDSDLEQTPTVALIEGTSYTTSFTTTTVATAALTLVIGGTEGTGRTTDSTFAEVIVAGSGTNIQVQADATTTGNADDVSVKSNASVGVQWRGGPGVLQVSAGTWGSGTVSFEASFDGGLRYVPMKDVNSNALTTLSADAFYNFDMGPCLVRTAVLTATIVTGQAALRSAFDATVGS